MDFASERRHAGDLAQLFELRELRFSGGRAEGTRGILVSNDAGMEAVLLPDRCLDLFSLKYNGRNLGYLTPAGIVHPAYWDRSGKNWLKTYSGGFFATCGLSNIGSPCADGGEELSLHGELAHTPAEQVCARVIREDGVPAAEISGVMRVASLFGGHLTLARTVQIKYHENRVRVTDVITNEGGERAPYMTLYHFNMGWPLLSEKARMQISSRRITPRTPHAAAHLAQVFTLTAPAEPYEEMCYYHELERGADGFAAVGVENPVSGLAARIRFDASVLDHFVQWKMLGTGDYALGLEPCNATIDGRADARQNGSLKFLDSGQSVTHRLEVTVGPSLAAIADSIR